MPRTWMRAGVAAGVLLLAWLAAGRSSHAFAQQPGPPVTGARCNMADVVPNGQIDIADMQRESSYYGTVLGYPGYDPRYDVNDPYAADGNIDILDIQFVYGLFGMTCMPPPSVTTSRYMSTVDSTTLYQEGCSQAQAVQTGLVVLDFGQPWVQNGVYGTYLVVYPLTFASTAQIATAAESFAAGYYACMWVHGPSLTLAIGTSNDLGSGGAVTYSDGWVWASLVNQVAAYVQAHGFDTAITVYGADDIETGCSSAASARSWVDGYAAGAQHPYVDYGDAGECPVYPGGANAPCGSTGWTQLDVRYVAWGAPYADFPVPDIYRTDRAQAGQWASIDALDPLVVYGEMTQLGACQWLQQHGYTPCDPSLENDPAYAWAQLYFTLAWDFLLPVQQPPP